MWDLVLLAKVLGPSPESSGSPEGSRAGEGPAQIGVLEGPPWLREEQHTEGIPLLPALTFLSPPTASGGCSQQAG